MPRPERPLKFQENAQSYALQFLFRLFSHPQPETSREKMFGWDFPFSFFPFSLAMLLQIVAYFAAHVLP